MLRALYDRCMNLARHRRAGSWLFGISFVESSFFPIPPDVMLIPMVIAERAKAAWYAFLCTAGSVAGALLGYVIGYFLFDLVGQPVFEAYGYADKFESFRGQYNDYGAWIVLFAGVTPFPYKVITIASGATALNLGVFILASIVARGLRFGILAGLLYYFGPPIREFIERRLGLVFTLGMIALIGGFVAIRFVL
ncbi:MAG: YqaA family protein [Pseudomonadota bacterium]